MRVIPGETALCGRVYKDWLANNGLNDSIPEPVDLVPVGLRNVRNVCFLNAILQCLYYTPMLRRSLSLAFESAVVKDEWLVALRHLFKELDSSRSSKACVAATRMASLMQSASTNGEFQHGEQADAHEAFVLIISKLLEGCISARGLSIAEKEQLEQSSLIGHIFSMMLNQSVTCKTCKDKSSYSRAEYCFCVTCPSFTDRMRTRDRKNVVDVKELLSSFTQEEHISEWKCEKCSSSGCVRQAGIARPPNVLLVHISRIQQGWAPQVTVDRDLTIQYDGSSANTRRKVRYLLFAMIVYRSMGANGGHYFAFVRAGRGQREQWYLADDDEIRSVSFADVQREEPFMLLYEAQKMIPPVETDAEKKLLEAELVQASVKAQVQARAAQSTGLLVEQARAPAIYTQVDDSTRSSGRLEMEEACAKMLEPEDAYTPGTDMSSTTAGSEGRSRLDEHVFVRTQPDYERTVDFDRWSFFSSCRCSLPYAEYSEGFEDDRLHCM
ncbi:UBP23 [Symbiodinium pilosum]|uniref:ubiquitinyl hydrolase 1 n=1 Tax=Symbiodinium pilosum TaxID=2952 RepID=A0A812X345_SYMPI|nr:UBP23 [Symbiodinium pilosum]